MSRSVLLDFGRMLIPLLVRTDKYVENLLVIHSLLTVLHFKERTVPLGNHKLYELQVSQQTLLINFHSTLVSFHVWFLLLCFDEIVALGEIYKTKQQNTKLFKLPENPDKSNDMF